MSNMHLAVSKFASFRTTFVACSVKIYTRARIKKAEDHKRKDESDIFFNIASKEAKILSVSSSEWKLCLVISAGKYISMYILVNVGIRLFCAC
jgi:hypothetical protein